MEKKESAPDVAADEKREVFQDVGTHFFSLLAIYFPAVTGIMTGWVRPFVRICRLLLL